MEDTIELSGHGVTLSAYPSKPTQQAKGGLVLIHEVWGLVPHTRDVANRFAHEGYHVIAPSLVDDAVMPPEVAAQLQQTLFDPKQRSEAQPKMREVMAPLHSPEFAQHTMAGLHAAVDYLADADDVGGRIGVVGFCLGGTYAFSLAAEEPRLKAAVPFYGRSDLTAAQLKGISCPVLAFYGQNDHNLVDNLPELKQRMADAGIDFTPVVYPDTGHAFFNDTNKRTYNKDAAEDSWQRTLAFLQENLSGQ